MIIKRIYVAMVIVKIIMSALPNKRKELSQTLFSLIEVVRQENERKQLMQKTLSRLEYCEKLDALAEKLLKHETLSKEEVDKILKDASKPAD